MNITFDEAVKLFRSADVVKISNMNEDQLVNTGIGEDVVGVYWNDDEDYEYAYYFHRDNNEQVEREGHGLTFAAEDGEPFQVLLYKLQPMSD